MILNLLVARTITALSTPVVVKSSNQQRNGRKYPAAEAGISSRDNHGRYLAAVFSTISST
jgi:hypothetical protein